MWSITKFWGFSHISGAAEPKVVKFCTRVGNINSMQQDDIIITNKRAWLWSRDGFKILPLVAMQQFVCCTCIVSYTHRWNWLNYRTASMRAPCHIHVTTLAAISVVNEFPWRPTLLMIPCIPLPAHRRGRGPAWWTDTNTMHHCAKFRRNRSNRGRYNVNFNIMLVWLENAPFWVVSSTFTPNDVTNRPNPPKEHHLAEPRHLSHKREYLSRGSTWALER